MKKILYLTFDGVLEPLGYSQVISYLKNLSHKNKITIISIEKNKDLLSVEHKNKINNILKENNISWKYFCYSKKNIFKIFLVFKLFFYIYFEILVKKNKIIHCRSYVMGFIAYILSFFLNFSFIFDIRGFWIEERVEWGLWKKNNFKYKFFKFFENKIYSKSKAIVTLTTDAKKEILLKKIKNVKNENIYIIPTSVKLNNKSLINYDHKLINFTHLGAIGSRYNFDIYLKILSQLKKNRKIFLSIINKDEHNSIKILLNKYKFTNSEFEIKYIPPYNVSSQIIKSNFGMFFPISGYYLKAYFPTKLGEFISNGIPVITSRINNHVDELIIRNNIGIIIDDFENINYAKLNEKISYMISDKDVATRCLNVARQSFDLNIACQTYNNIYQSIK